MLHPYVVMLPGGHRLDVDAEDWEALRGLSWQASARPGKNRTNHYAVSAFRLPNGSRRVLRMHRLIADAKPGEIVDHIDGNGLNNTKSNLRICTHQQNVRSQHVFRGASRYKGVYRDEHRKLWRAGIKVNGKTIHLGAYETEEQAAISYDLAAVRYFGDFAVLNSSRYGLEGI